MRRITQVREGLSTWTNHPVPHCLRASSALDLLHHFASDATLAVFLDAGIDAVSPLVLAESLETIPLLVCTFSRATPFGVTQRAKL